MANNTKFYRIVPKRFVDNVQYRKNILQWCAGSEDNRDLMRVACYKDPLFWINTFCWLFEPRPGQKSDDDRTVLPFITWPHQDSAVRDIQKHLGRRDIGVEKSRGEGASWIGLMMFLHRWIFRPMQAFGLVSRNELAVDNPEDPDSLMWKLDWELTKLPRWMVPDFNRNNSKHVLRNLENGSTIVGYSATGDVASGGRKTAFLMDELAKFARGPDQQAMDSTQHVTECRIIVSTPKGSEGAYYKAMTEESSMVKIILDWKDNPTRNRFTYSVVNGMPHLVKKLPMGVTWKYGAPNVWGKVAAMLQRRGYSLDDGKVRSPWYDKQCLRPMATPRSIAQELDRDYGGSETKFFTIAVIERLILQATRPPLVIGTLVPPSDRARESHKWIWSQNPNGYLQLWCKLNTDGRPPKVSYIVGADIASGTGGEYGSNSTLSIVEALTGTKIATYASPNILPEPFADYAIAACHFFADDKGNPALLIWEDNGYGGQFRNRLFETEFRNFYMRTITDRTSRRKSKKAGFYSQLAIKREMLGAYNAALADGTFDNPDKVSLEECRKYVMGPSGSVFHSAANSAEDPSGAGANHGDRVIADGLANWARNDWGLGKEKSTDNKPTQLSSKAPEGSYLQRRQLWVEKHGSKAW